MGLNESRGRFRPSPSSTSLLQFSLSVCSADTSIVLSSTLSVSYRSLKLPRPLVALLSTLHLSPPSSHPHPTHHSNSPGRALRPTAHSPRRR